MAVDGLSDTAAAECIEELGVLKRLLKACSEDCAWSVSITITLKIDQFTKVIHISI